MDVDLDCSEAKAWLILSCPNRSHSLIEALPTVAIFFIRLHPLVPLKGLELTELSQLLLSYVGMGPKL